MTDVMVFTDLDGSLLDHETYAFDAALPALEALARADIPVSIVSSKTRAEIIPLVSQLKLEGPIIAENGAVIAYPEGSVDSAGHIDDIRQALEALPENLRADIKGFGDMSIAEISQLTGLGEAASALAAQREASEPFLWSGEGAPDKDLFADKGFHITRGGRFYHIIPGRDKADAIRRVTSQMAKPDAKIWALGDGPNDLSMLLAATKGALIFNPSLQVTAQLPVKHSLYLTKQAGPSGWAEAIFTFLGEKKT
jgi:mannosyl-3-phosphoglycerate phosphatase